MFKYSVIKLNNCVLGPTYIGGNTATWQQATTTVFGRITLEKEKISTPTTPSSTINMATNKYTIIWILGFIEMTFPCCLLSSYRVASYVGWAMCFPTMCVIVQLTNYPTIFNYPSDPWYLIEKVIYCLKIQPMNSTTNNHICFIQVNCELWTAVQDLKSSNILCFEWPLTIRVLEW